MLDSFLSAMKELGVDRIVEKVEDNHRSKRQGFDLLVDALVDTGREILSSV
jgi:hypothetical protein